MNQIVGVIESSINQATVLLNALREAVEKTETEDQFLSPKEISEITGYTLATSQVLVAKINKGKKNTVKGKVLKSAFYEYYREVKK